MAETHDYRKGVLRWGHNIEILGVLAEGQTLRVAGWGGGLAKDDYLLLSHTDGRETRYRIESISYQLDPPDMWFADLVFAPRDIQADFQKVMDS